MIYSFLLIIVIFVITLMITLSAFADVSIEHIINKLESDIRNLDEWFLNNYMLLNQSKCQFLITESNRSLRIEKAKIKLSDEYIDETS